MKIKVVVLFLLTSLWIGMCATVLICVFTSPPTCSHLHVSGQGADPSLTSSTRQEDGDDGQQGADSQQSTAS